MNIPPNSNQPIPSNDPSIPPKDPTNAPIKTIPDDVMKHIISYTGDKGMESATSTTKPWTNLTVVQVKDSRVSELNALIDNLSKMIDEYSENLDESEIQELQQTKKEILAFKNKDILGSANLIDLKSSLFFTKLALAKTIAKLPQKFYLNDKINESSGFSQETLKLANLYRAMNEFQTHPMLMTRIAEDILFLGDVPTAMKIVGSFPTGIAVDFLQKWKNRDEIPDQLLDQLVVIVNGLRENQFKNEICIAISSIFLEKGNLDKCLEFFNKTPKNFSMYSKDELSPEIIYHLQKNGQQLKARKFMFDNM